MKKTLVLLAILGMTVGANAALITGTSFENEAVPGGKYTDLGDAAVDHDLLPNAGEPIIDSTVATELGYDASYINSLGDVGLTDGDYVGVTNYTGGGVGSYTDGVQGYQMSDADGTMVLTFDAVDLTGYTAVAFSMDLFVQSTGYEAADAIVAKLLLDSGEIVLLDTTGSDINDLAIEGAWMELATPIADSVASAQLVVSLTSNSAYEAIFMDDVQFTGIPEPATMALLGLGSLGLIRRKK